MTLLSASYLGSVILFQVRSTLQASVAPPPLGPRGETHMLAWEVVGGPNYDEGTDTLVLNVQYTIIPLTTDFWKYI
jgi:hypothetical protein